VNDIQTTKTIVVGKEEKTIELNLTTDKVLKHYKSFIDNTYVEEHSNDIIINI